MKRSHQRTLAAVYKHPTSANIAWKDIEGLFLALGAEVLEREGSRIAVVLFGEVRVFHRPHPSPHTDKGAVVSVRRWLEPRRWDRPAWARAPSGLLAREADRSEAIAREVVSRLPGRGRRSRRRCPERTNAKISSRCDARFRVSAHTRLQRQRVWRFELARSASAHVSG